MKVCLKQSSAVLAACLLMEAGCSRADRGEPGAVRTLEEIVRSDTVTLAVTVLIPKAGGADAVKLEPSFAVERLKEDFLRGREIVYLRSHGQLVSRDGNQRRAFEILFYFEDRVGGYYLATLDGQPVAKEASSPAFAEEREVAAAVPDPPQMPEPPQKPRSGRVGVEKDREVAVPKVARVEPAEDARVRWMEGMDDELGSDSDQAAIARDWILGYWTIEERLVPYDGVDYMKRRGDLFSQLIELICRKHKVAASMISAALAEHGKEVLQELEQEVRDDPEAMKRRHQRELARSRRAQDFRQRRGWLVSRAAQSVMQDMLDDAVRVGIERHRTNQRVLRQMTESALNPF